MAEDSSQDKIKQLEARLDYLESIARETVARLYAIEKQLGLVFGAVPRELRVPADERETRAAGTQPQPPSAASPKTPAHVQPSVHQRVTQESAQLGAPGRPVAPLPPGSAAERSSASARSTAPSRTNQKGDLESRIGGSWFNRIGVLAIFLGVAFFLKYAVDNQWIGPTARVLIGGAIGIAFLIGGERLRKRYPGYAYGLTGGGIAVLYASIWFASFKAYNLLEPTIAFVMMALVTASASLLAARYNALPIAVLGLIGGFLTPVLLSTGVDNQTGLFSYIALLDAGVLALAYSKHWRSLNYLSFIATALMFGGWMVIWYAPEKLWTTILFLMLFFMIFALLAVLYNVVNRRPTSWLDLGLVFSNALLYFGTSYELLDDRYHNALGAFALLVAAFHLGLGFLTYRRDPEDSLLVYTFLGLGVLFTVLAVPIQFDQHWVTMGWGIEGAILTWIGLRANDRTSRYAALIVFVIALSHWVIVDMHDFSYAVDGAFVPLLNRRALSGAILVAALAASALFYKRYGEGLERSSVASFLTVGANALAITLLTIDANDYFEQKKAIASGRSDWDSLGNTKALTLTGLWTVYGLGALFAGIRGRIKALRFLALVLLAGAIVKVLTVDLNYYAESWHTTILNQTFFAFALIVAVLACAAWFYGRASEADTEERDVVIPLLIGAANVIALIALSAEVLGHFARARADVASTEADRLENTKQFVLSTVWTVYGAAALLIGIKRNRQALRIGALLLLGWTIAKVMFLDLSYYDSPWHTLIFNQTFAAFALMVYALALGAKSYNRAGSIDKRERSTMVPVMVAAANVLAMVALSAEALGYYEVKLSASDLTTAARVDLRLAQQLSLSVVWTIYGGAMLTLGIARRSKLLRIMALSLLGLTIFKVFLLDLSSLQKLYRIISFIVLGAILLAVSFLYQRYRRQVSEFIDVDPQEPISAGSE